MLVRSLLKQPSPSETAQTKLIYKINNSLFCCARCDYHARYDANLSHINMYIQFIPLFLFYLFHRQALTTMALYTCAHTMCCFYAYELTWHTISAY